MKNWPITRGEWGSWTNRSMRIVVHQKREGRVMSRQTQLFNCCLQQSGKKECVLMWVCECVSVCVCVCMCGQPYQTNPIQLSSGEQVQSFMHVCVCVCVCHYYSRVTGSVLLIQKCWAGGVCGSWCYVCACVCVRVCVCVCVCVSGQHKTPLVFCKASPSFPKAVKKHYAICHSYLPVNFNT